MLYYLDASAWVKRYYEEKGTDLMLSYFQADNTFACSTLGMVEIIGVMARKHKAGAFGVRHIHQIYRDIEADWSRFIQIQITNQVFESAKELARTHALRGADAIHLSSAQYLWQQFSETEAWPVIVVSDHELKEAALSLGIECLDPADGH